MARHTRKMYMIAEDFPLVIYGSSLRYESENDGRSLVTIIIGVVIVPYSASYSFFVTLVVLIRQRIKQLGVARSAKTINMQRSLYILQILQFCTNKYRIA
ncbi:hypothetical protein PMAYCL1PPCAC_10935, partial [Pristionchus mayeri]